MDNRSVIEVGSPKGGKKISVLAPGVGTFSADTILFCCESGLFKNLSGKPEDLILVPTNAGIVDSVIKHGGWGVLAMGTLVKGQRGVEHSLYSLVNLIYEFNENPFHIAAAVKMKLNFCLMAKVGVSRPEVEGVVAHEKALDACKNNVSELFKETGKTEVVIEATSNGVAASLVAENPEYSNYAVLGPKSAAERYGLQILEEHFEDKRAVTTFFLFSPTSQEVNKGKNNRAFLVFKVKDEPMALINVMLPFSSVGLNTVNIHSFSDGDGGYDFALELEVKEEQLKKFETAMIIFKLNIIKYLCFGPFVVLEG